MDVAVRNGLIRRELLEILLDAVNQARRPGDDISMYLVEPLIQGVLATRGYPMRLEEMRGQLFWLYERRGKDADHGYVRFRDKKVGGQTLVFWRITDRGTDVLEGTIADPGIASA